MENKKNILIILSIALSGIIILSALFLWPKININNIKEKLNPFKSLFVDKFNTKIEIRSNQNKVLKITLLSAQKFISFAPLYLDKIIGINERGEIIEINIDTLNEKILYSIEGIVNEAKISPSGSALIYSFFDSKNNKKNIYLNIHNKSQAEITANIKALSFSPKGDQFVLLTDSDNEGSILLSKDGKNFSRLLKTRMNVFTLDWVSDFISVITYDQFGYGSLLLIKDKDNLIKLLDSVYGLDVRWSKSGESLIFSGRDENDVLNLFYLNQKSEKIKKIPAQVQASKCIWLSNKEIICGIKNNKNSYKEDFYKININNDEKKLIAVSNTDLIIKSLALNASENSLYILNGIDNKIYIIKDLDIIKDKPLK